MSTRNPHRHQTIAVIEPNQAQAYRLKARLLGEGYRYVEVFLSRDAFRNAVKEGYTPDRILPDTEQQTGTESAPAVATG